MVKSNASNTVTRHTSHVTFKALHPHAPVHVHFAVLRDNVKRAEDVLRWHHVEYVRNIGKLRSKTEAINLRVVEEGGLP